MKTDFIIQTRMRDVTRWIFEKVNTFPKKQRFVLGQQIQNSSVACLRLIVEANNARETKWLNSVLYASTARSVCVFLASWSIQVS